MLGIAVAAEQLATGNEICSGSGSSPAEEASARDSCSAIAAASR